MTGKHQKMALAVGLSIALHGYFLVVGPSLVEPGQPTLPPRLDVLLEEPAPIQQQPPSQPEEQVPAPPSEPVAVLEPSESEPVAADAPPEVEERRFEVVNRTVLSAIVDGVEADAVTAFMVPACNPSEAASQIRTCRREDRTFAEAPVLAGFAEAFAQLRTESVDFDGDMARVEALLVKQERIEQMQPTDELSRALLAEQQREIRDEILRIDRRYASVNLLKLIPMGAKVVRGLREK